MAKIERVLPGAKWRQTHQSTVNSVLGADPNSDSYRRVRSQGSSFYNKDSWYARSFAAALCEWARLNKEVQPTGWDIRSWTEHSAQRAQYQAHDRGITIAATPDDLGQELALALVGGAYHEAWHTAYSRRQPLRAEEVTPRIQELWARIPWAPERGFRGWSKLTSQLLTWSNIIEDIRIERLGCQEFPGAPEKMEALQDLILRMEKVGVAASGHRVLDSSTLFVSTVMGAFRDLGLGYQTSLQREALDVYKTRCPEAWHLVHDGELRPLLDRAIQLKKEDDIESLWLAMEVLAVLCHLAAPAAAAKWAAKKAAEDKKAADEAAEKDAEKRAREEAEKKAREEAEKRAREEAPLILDQVDATPDEDDEIPEAEAIPTSVVTQKPPIYKVGDEVALKTAVYFGRKAVVSRASLPDPQTGVQELEFTLVEED